METGAEGSERERVNGQATPIVRCHDPTSSMFEPASLARFKHSLKKLSNAANLRRFPRCYITCATGGS